MDRPSVQRLRSWAPLLFFLVFAILVYRTALPPDRVILTTDDNMGALALRKVVLPEAFLGGWNDNYAMGQPAFAYFTWTNILLYLLPLRFFNDWIHAIDLLFASVAFAAWLRVKGFSRVAQCIGGFVAAWVGSTFFLTYAGHIGKFGTVVFAALYLWLVEVAIQRRSLAWAVLAGAALGNMFLEQADVALFFAIPLGAYAVWGTVREHGFAAGPLLKVPLVVAILAGIVAYHPIQMSRTAFSLDRQAQLKGSVSDPQANWDYCTSWSWPPEETIEFVVPGYMGWRTGDPDGPYWGRLGRTPGWEQHKQGLMNLRHETLYKGIIPVWLAGLAVAFAFRRGVRGRGDLIFWSSAAALTYVLALGRFTPLYHLFFSLPGISSIRAPVKFMQSFQFALAFLAAYGFDALRGRITGVPAAWLKRGFHVIAGLAVVFLLWQFVSQGPADSDFHQFIRERASPAQAQALFSSIAKTSKGGLQQTALLCIVAAAAAWFLIRGKDQRMIGAAGLVLFGAMAVDQLRVSGRFVMTAKTEAFFDENALTRDLKQNLDHRRVCFVPDDGTYNALLTYRLPYHQIPARNVTQWREPEDYTQFFRATSGQRIPLEQWRMMAVGAILCPVQVAGYLLNSPETTNHFIPRRAYAMSMTENGGHYIYDATRPEQQQHILLEPAMPAPRYQLIGAWKVMDDEALLAELGTRGRDPFAVTLLNRRPDVTLAEQTNSPGPAGSVTVENYMSGRVTLKVKADRECLLRVADKYESAWRCEVDGQPAQVMRCDHICMAVHLQPGEHRVALAFKPSGRSIYAQVAGITMSLLALIGIGLERFRR